MSSKDFMEILRKKVEEEYEEDKEFVLKFFIKKNFTFEQAKELTHSLRRAVFYLRRDVDKRRVWEKKTINYLYYVVLQRNRYTIKNIVYKKLIIHNKTN